MFFPFLGFGILLILRAASTESAPRRNYYPELAEDEMDELAVQNFAADRSAAVNLADNLEIEQALNYLTGGRPLKYGYPNLTPKTAKGPFAYRPNTPEFYMPAEALRAVTNNDEPNDLFQDAVVELHPETRTLGHQVPPHMKKNSRQLHADDDEEDGQDSDGGAVVGSQPQLVAPPSHVMTSSHAVDHSGFGTATRLPDQSYSSFYIILVAAGSAMGVIMLVGAGICWYRINERIKATADVDYPAYGVTGPSKDVSPTGGDRKLAQSAHMYHYQHQKQQMAALQKTPLAAGEGQGSAGSDVESDDENEEGDYTVYECPGLAPAGDMEVKNPLYQDEPTPATPQTLKGEDPVQGSSSSSQ